MEPPILLNERVPGKQFPVGLQDVIARALAKKPEDRFQTASEFATALAVFGEPGSERLLPALSPSPPPMGKPNNAPTQPAPARASGPGAGLLIGVAAACLALGVVIAVVVMRFLVK
jgi:serine/threonine-protein kinase